MRVLLFLILLLTSQAAAAQWFEATTPRLRVYSNVGADEARRVAQRLETLDAAMRHFRNIDQRELGSAARLTVYVVKSASQMTKMVGPTVAGFYIPRAGGSVAFVPSARTAFVTSKHADAVLFHEYAHNFLYRNAPGAYPAWFSEGFAEFHGSAVIERDGSVVFGNAAVGRGYTILMSSQLPIEKLLEPGSAGLDFQQTDNLYGRGWVLTHMLTFSKPRAGQLMTYLRNLRAGQDSVAAARGAFGDLAVLDQELRAYARRKLTGARIYAARLAIPPIAVRALPAAESDIMDVHIESTSGVTEKEAKALLPRARRLARPHPDNAFVQGVLAEAEFDAGNHVEARDAALRALAADPKSRQGLTYHGLALAGLAATAGDTSLATYRAVIAPWQRANRLDPDDPRPMTLIYGAAESFGQRSPAIVKAILYAQAIAPEDRGLAAIAAREYLQDGKVAPARALIASLAYDPHAANREKMAAVLALIDANDAKGAVIALQRKPGAKDTANADAEAT